MPAVHSRNPGPRPSTDPQLPERNTVPVSMLRACTAVTMCRPGSPAWPASRPGWSPANRCWPFGLSRNVLDRLLRADSWRRLAVGIYLTAPVDPSWAALSWAGVLIGGDRARLGPES